MGTAIIAPAHLPGGVIGAIVWASPEVFDIRPVFQAQAAELSALSLRLLAAYSEHGVRPDGLVRLTRREIQCLKWAAHGNPHSPSKSLISLS